MSNRMPKDIQELLDQVHDPEKLKEFIGKWNDYIKANDDYERTYPQQFANLTEGNLRFKQDKVIPTPAEQLEQYRDLMRDELNDYLHDRQQDRQGHPEQDEMAQEDIAITQSQELMLTWMKDFKEEQAKQAQTSLSQDKEEEKANPDELTLTFGNEGPPEHGYEPVNDNDPTIDERDRY